MPTADVKAKVVARLRDALRAGNIPPGGRLPTERSLAEQEGCDRRTARAALALLEAEGSVRRISPHVRVAAHPVDRASAAFMRNGLLLVTERQEDSESSPDAYLFLREVDVGVLAVAQAEGLHLLTFHRSRLDTHELSSALALQPRGVIVTEPALSGGAMLRLVPPLCRKFAVPLVVCSDGPECALLDRVVSDHEEGGRRLCAWLVSQGCRRIVEVGVSPESAYWVAARTRGYRDACLRAGLEPQPRIQIPSVFWAARSRAEFDRAVRFFAGYLAEGLARGPVDALMAQNDIDAVLVMEACQVLGLVGSRMPKVTGYDNILAGHPIRKWSGFRPAATMEKHNRQQGEAMVGLALARSGGKLTHGAVRRVVAPDMVVDSGEP